MTEASHESFKNFEIACWEKCAEAYDASFTPLTLQAGEALAAALGIGSGTKVLEVACGPGHLAARLAALGAVVVGADFSPQMVALAKQHYPEQSFEVGDAESLRYQDESFDSVLINFGVLHLGRPEAAVLEAKRVLRKGGRFGFSVWALPADALGFEVVLQAIEEHGNKDVVLPSGPPFFKYSDPANSEALLSGAGLSGFQFRKIPMRWELASPNHFFTAFLNGTARTGGLLRAQPPEVLERIRDSITAKALERFAAGKGSALYVPMPAMMYWAAK